MLTGSLARYQDLSVVHSATVCAKQTCRCTTLPGLASKFTHHTVCGGFCHGADFALPQSTQISNCTANVSKVFRAIKTCSVVSGMLRIAPDFSQAFTALFTLHPTKPSGRCLFRAKLSAFAGISTTEQGIFRVDEASEVLHAVEYEEPVGVFRLGCYEACIFLDQTDRSIQKPPFTVLPYSAMKHFYQFSYDRTCLLLGIEQPVNVTEYYVFKFKSQQTVHQLAAFLYQRLSEVDSTVLSAGTSAIPIEHTEGSIEARPRRPHICFPRRVREFLRRRRARQPSRACSCSRQEEQRPTTEVVHF